MSLLVLPDDLPSSLDVLEQMSKADLKEVHSKGKCPNISSLNGIAKGIILDPQWFESMHLWRGKVFNLSSAGDVSGFNRMGVGSFEYLRYRFNVRIGQSAFSDRNVIFLDHDLPENPYWVRIFHDELVEMREGLYLASSHLRIGKKLRYVSYFAFDFGQI